MMQSLNFLSWYHGSLVLANKRPSFFILFHNYNDLHQKPLSQ